MPDATKTLKRSFFQRLFGKSATQPPANADCWRYADNVVTVDLSHTPELNQPGGAIRIEGDSFPERVLVIHGDDGKHYAFKNVCTHGKRRLDPVPGAGTVQCCSVGKSTFDYNGELLAGSAKEDIAIFAVTHEGNELKITLS